MFAPAASATFASAQMRSTARSRPSAPSAAGHVVSIVHDLNTSELDAAQLLELAVEQDRVVDHELARVLGRLVEQVALGADARAHAHHDRLADRVDRRVRHLREELLEVRVEERLAAGQHGERRVVAHRADRLLGVPRERREDRLHVLLRVAEEQLPRAQRLRRRRRRRRARRQLREAQLLALDPLRVRAAASRPRASSPRRGRCGPAARSTRKSLPGCSRPLRTTFSGALVEHARLGGEHDPAVGGLVPAAGAEAVAVERRADHAPVGERDRRRAVPRLHQALVERVEAAQLGRHVVAALVRLGDHHHQRVRQRAAGEHEQLEHVVERRGVGAAGPDDRQHLLRGRRRRAPTRAATRARASS